MREAIHVELLVLFEEVGDVDELDDLLLEFEHVARDSEQPVDALEQLAVRLWRE
jgi:hypothetical protein